MPLSQQQDATRWDVLKTLIFIAGISAAIFTAGMSVGSVKDTAERLATFEVRAERLYVRKDGQELAEIRAQLKALNDKLDYLIQQGMR